MGRGYNTGLNNVLQSKEKKVFNYVQGSQERIHIEGDI